MSAVLKLRARKCRVCREKFTPRNSFQVVCDVSCSVEYARQQRAKPKRAKRFKGLREWRRDATTAFNAYVRARDKHLGCVSCDLPPTWGGQWHASHYRPAGVNSALRFDERNCHKSCSPCNNHKSGNLIEYRKRLIGRIGLAEVEALESNHETKRWTADELRAIRDTYRAKLKELRDGR